MRVIDPAFQAHLNTGATQICRCWRVSRSDGVVFGFTDHDGPLRFAETDFAANSGLTASALQRSTGLSVDNAHAVGAISADAITETDIAAGRFDGAKVEIWYVNWADTDQRVMMFAGALGEITRGNGAFEAELRGVADELNRPNGRSLMRNCDAVFGDTRCGVDASNPIYRGTGTVADVSGVSVGVSGLNSYAAQWFKGGVLTWITGGNAGSISRVTRDVTGVDRRLSFTNLPGLPILVGDTFNITTGCDRTVKTCKSKFNNFSNFRGFPHIPGEDWMTAYPNRGEAHDGSSLLKR